MACALAYPLADVLLDSIPSAALVEKRDVLFPAEADHHAQTMLERYIEQPSRRNCICPDGIRAHARNACEISGDCYGIVVKAAFRGGSKWPVRYAADEKLLITNKDELPAHFRTRLGRRRARVTGLAHTGSARWKCYRRAAGLTQGFAVRFCTSRAQQLSEFEFPGIRIRRPAAWTSMLGGICTL